MRLKVAEEEWLPVDTEKESCIILIVIVSNNPLHLLWWKGYWNNLVSGDLAISVSAVSNHSEKHCMVDGLDPNCLPESGFSESSTEAKAHHRLHTSVRTEEPLELIHSNMCGKIGIKSLNGGEYFVTVIDNHTCYAWIYILKAKAF